MTLFEKLNEQLKTAMKNKDEKRLSVIRMLKSKILLVNARGDISDDEAQVIINKYAKSLKETINITRQNNQEEAAKEAEAELVIVKEFLPEEMSEDQIKAAVQKVVAETGAASPADMGKVMKAVMPLVKGADGNIVKNLVMAALQKK
jgi:uncharacterized protein YqeY